MSVSYPAIQASRYGQPAGVGVDRSSQVYTDPTARLINKYDLTNLRGTVRSADKVALKPSAVKNEAFHSLVQGIALIAIAIFAAVTSGVGLGLAIGAIALLNFIKVGVNTYQYYAKKEAQESIIDDAVDSRLSDFLAQKPYESRARNQGVELPQYAPAAAQVAPATARSSLPWLQ